MHGKPQEPQARHAQLSCNGPPELYGMSLHTCRLRPKGGLRARAPRAVLFVVGGGVKGRGVGEVWWVGG